MVLLTQIRSYHAFKMCVLFKQQTHLTICIAVTITVIIMKMDRQTPVYQPLFQDNLGKPAPERLNHSGFQWSKRWWGGSSISWTIRKSFTHCFIQITTPAPHHLVFTGQMLLLTPNQQHQSTEGKVMKMDTDPLLVSCCSWYSEYHGQCTNRHRSVYKSSYDSLLQHLLRASHNNYDDWKCRMMTIKCHRTSHVSLQNHMSSCSTAARQQ